MKIKAISIIVLIVFGAVLLASCGSPATVVVEITSTPAVPTATMDLCAPENIKDSALAVHRLMRAFDDTAQIATNTTREQLSGPVSALQSVRRQVEDVSVPECLVNLKNLGLAHMNAVITTLISFMGGADTDTINTGISLARAQRQAYDDELTRLIGATFTPAPTLPLLPTSPPPTATPAP